MNQQFLLTNLSASLLDLHQVQTKSHNEGHHTGSSPQDESSHTFNNTKLITALLQIWKIFDNQLMSELRINKLLLEKLCHVDVVPRGNGDGLVKEEGNFGDGVVERRNMVERAGRFGKERKLAVNDTKNISKNFGKAVITFIQKNPQKIKAVLRNHGVDVDVFSNELKERKKNLISIKELRSLWLDSEFEYAKPFRQISYMFLRKASFKYIFGSRIADYSGHLKYRRRMIEALHSPHQFLSIKH